MKNIALLSNVNIDPLKNLIENDFGGIYTCGYNQWQSDLLNTESELYQFNPDYIFIYLCADESNFEIEDLFLSINFFSKNNPSTLFIVADFSLAPFSALSYLSENTRIEHNLNNKLKELSFENNNLFIFELNRLISLYGYLSVFDEKFWYLGRIGFSYFGFQIIAKELRNVLNCLRGKIKKVLILDLDNTLWGGILTEEGSQNIQISAEGTSRIYADFQKNIKKLASNGILLGICSKNDENEVRKTFETNKNLILKWDDFIVHKINWQLKSQNIAEIASELNIGTESMVFIDDSNVERELVKSAFQDIAVPEFPADTTSLNRWFINEVVYSYFPKRALTIEDKEKFNQYKRNSERQHIKHQLNYDDFLQQLSIRLSIKKVDVNTCDRIAQLTQKTNQFNLSLVRYTEAEIRMMIKDESFIVYQCEYDDKFGKEGIIGCAVVKLNGKEAILDSFMLSCRVLGRKVENSFFAHIIDELKKQNIQTLVANYYKTDKNLQIQEFINLVGFKTDEDDTQKYIMEILK
ncbi:MAG: HAD-IIIC family phosphatase [Paludibacteraceae bacterium]